MISKIISIKSNILPVQPINDGRFYLHYGIEGCVDSSILGTAYEIIFKGSLNEATQKQIELDNDVINLVKSSKISEVSSIASSSTVKRFIKSDKNLWWDSETRSSIRSSINARTSNWYLEFDGEIITYPSKKEALSIIDKIEIYASDCHKAVCTMTNEINELTTIDEVRNYPITFPEPVNLDTTNK